MFFFSILLCRLFEFRKVVSNRNLCYNLVPRDYPVEITKEEKTSECHLIEGKFLTPLELYMPGLVPKAAQEAHFQMLLPLKWENENHKPICIQLAGTGDHVSDNIISDKFLTNILINNFSITGEGEILWQSHC